jgi:hypothetical protein
MECINAIMEFELEGKKRETVRDPMYKKVGKDGRVYIDKGLADQEILIIPVKSVPEDKIHYIKVGR